MNASVVWQGKARWTAKALLPLLTRDFAGRVNEAYLIGSYAEARATNDSDIDVIAVCETKISWPDRGRAFSDVLSKYPLDLIIYTPNEWAMLRREPSPFIWHAQKSWKRFI